MNAFDAAIEHGGSVEDLPGFTSTTWQRQCRILNIYRWLTTKYPKIVTPVIEEQPDFIDGEEVPIDISKKNPNGEETDNLYLDMNNIVHPCAHPEDRPAPETEEEMMLEIFRYIDRLVSMARPRKILMMAVGMFEIKVTKHCAPLWTPAVYSYYT